MTHYDVESKNFECVTVMSIDRCDTSPFVHIPNHKHIKEIDAQYEKYFGVIFKHMNTGVYKLIITTYPNGILKQLSFKASFEEPIMMITKSCIDSNKIRKITHIPVTEVSFVVFYRNGYILEEEYAINNGAIARLKLNESLTFQEDTKKPANVIRYEDGSIREELYFTGTSARSDGNPSGITHYRNGNRKLEYFSDNGPLPRYRSEIIHDK